MVDEIEELKFFSVAENKEEKCFFDFKYEFDAPHCYDFNRSETVWEAEESELWFESAGSYPPSPFVIKLNWRCDINGNGEFGNVSTDCDESDREESSCCKEDCMRAKTNSGVKTSLSRSSTLMKPTASYLAKQNHSRAGLSNQFHRRLQKKSFDRLDDKSTKSSSLTEVNATKRQKLEAGYLCKVAHLKHQARFVHKKSKTVLSLDGNSGHTKPKVTVPREPELQTARRAQRRRSKVMAELDENAKSNLHVFKALPLNKKILVAPSLPLPKKSLPQLPEFQLFHLRTLERARQHISNNEMKVPNYVSARNKNTGLRSFKSVNALKEKQYEAVNKFEACPLNNKRISSKGENGILQNTNETTATMEFKVLADRLSDEAPIELFNKLSLSSEVHSGEKSPEKMAHSEGFKENAPGPFILQCQRNGGMRYQCRSNRTTEIEQQLNINRSLRLDII